MKKKEFIILATVMACALLAMAVLHYGRNNKGAYVEVVVDNEVIEQYSLMKDGVYEITGHNGGENVLHIEDGCAYISEATCPDKLCVEQKEISKEGEMLVCLPNRVIVKAVGKEKNRTPIRFFGKSS